MKGGHSSWCALTQGGGCTVCATQDRPLPGRLFFWALGLGRKPAKHPVGLLELFFEAVVLQDEIAITVNHPSAQPGVDGFTANAVLVGGFAYFEAAVPNLKNYLILNLLFNMFADRHTESPFNLPVFYHLLARRCVQYMGRVTVVRKLWDMALTGTYTVAEITRTADRELGLRQPLRNKIGGNPLSYSATYAMFRNPFYMGKVRYGGQLIDGKHQPMVTEEEFNKVQQNFNTGYTTRPKDKDYTFMFRGMLKCGDCGFAVTTQRKVKKLKDGSESVHIYCHCTGRRKDYTCTQKAIYTRESDFIEQIKDRLSRFTIDPDFYQLAIEALAQENDETIAQQEAISSNQDKSIARKKDEIHGLQRMRYRGECSSDEFYESEMKKLEAELKDLLKARTKTEIESRDWRKLANETFTFARYAKDDFESDDLEKQQVVIKKLGQNLTVLDGKIQFTPVKYLVPIEEAYPGLTAQLEAVRTLPQQRKKAALDDLSSQWYTRHDSNV